MTYSIYITDWGDVRLSEAEASTLQTAQDARSGLAGSPFLEGRAVQRLFVREQAIIAACEAVARFKYESA